MRDGELIVGYRFANPQDTARCGVDGSMVLDQQVVSGPIYYWQPDPKIKMGYGVCRGCRVMSGGSTPDKNRSDAVRRWAHRHRCETRLDEMVSLHAYMRGKTP